MGKFKYFLNEKKIKAYHGTDIEFKNFDFTLLGSRYDRLSEPEAKKLSELGAWFTSNKNIDKLKTSPYTQVKEAIIELKKPYIVNTLDELWNESDNYNNGMKWRKDLINDGYDGVIIKNDTEFSGTSYIVFSNKQIKFLN